MLIKKLIAAFGLTIATCSHAQMAILNTSMGDITVELNPKAAPITVSNFIRYANEGFYDGTIFHRIIKNFMIQGGGFNAQMEQKEAHVSIQNEAFNGLKNDKYTIAMARTADPHSATAQFFINVKNNDFLNFSSKTPDGWGYTVFGRVIKGMEIVDKIEAKGAYTKTVGGFENVPINTITIKHVSIQP